MLILKSPQDLTAFNKKKNSLILVPTMGNLHAGHLSLINLAKKKKLKIMVSILVNPLQFSAEEDYHHYPRTLKEDFRFLKEKKVDYLFLPNAQTINQILGLNPVKDSFRVQVPDYLANPLCGFSRPHFFHGVATIVLKLFILFKPVMAVFGEKDYQQFLVIKNLVRSFNLKINLLLVPIFREKSGLALSSRNNYLNENEKIKASLIYQKLKFIRETIKRKKNVNFSSLREKVILELKKKNLMVEYLEIREEKKLKLLKTNFNKGRIFIAAKIGKTRLIDNQNLN